MLCCCCALCLCLPSVSLSCRCSLCSHVCSWLCRDLHRASAEAAQDHAAQAAHHHARTARIPHGGAQRTVGKDRGGGGIQGNLGIRTVHLGGHGRARFERGQLDAGTTDHTHTDTHSGAEAETRSTDAGGCNHSARLSGIRSVGPLDILCAHSRSCPPPLCVCCAVCPSSACGPLSLRCWRCASS